MRYILVVIGFAVSIQVQAQPRADSLAEVFMSPTRSVPLAFGMSAILPGAGQAYNQEWIKAGIALASEAAVLLLYSSWRQRGIDGRDAYQIDAHSHWSPVRYAYWLNEYTDYLNQLPDGRPITVSPVEIPELLFGINLNQPDTWTQSEQLAVRSLILEIRRVEGSIYHAETGAAFSHVLPFFGEQQYYELIGKYFQYAPGWDDYTALMRDGRITWIDENGNYIASIEPEAGEAGSVKPHVSARFYQYADDHGNANTYLRRASRITTLLIVNHMLAAVDAAVFSRIHNRRIQFGLGLMSDHQGRAHIAPHMRFSLNSHSAIE